MTGTSPQNAPKQPEKRGFYRVFELSEIGEQPLFLELEANSDDRAALVERLDVRAVDLLVGEVACRRTDRGVLAEGVARARLQRTCVASLEIMEETLESPFRVHYLKAFLESDMESDEDVELLDADAICPGEILVHEIALAMQSYPRKTGAASLAATHGRAAMDEGPFAALEALRDGEASPPVQKPPAQKPSAQRKKPN